MQAIGVILVVVGVVLALVGLVVLIVGRLGGDLPGDLRFQIGNVTVYTPCLTLIIISVVGSILLTIIINVILRLLNR